MPERYAFPALCEAHFNNNIATLHTWMEADDKKTISAFRENLKFIPRPYESDCYECSCGGVRVNLYNDFEFPLYDRFGELKKTHQYFRDHRVFNCTLSNMNHCEGMCWDGGYFRRWNHKYIFFFKHFLQYCSENSSCCCYWPEKNSYSRIINNKAYQLLKDLADKELVGFEFSPYWIAKEIEFDYERGKIYGSEYHPDSHGIASSLTTYSFFYSQYHQMLLTLPYSLIQPNFPENYT